MSIQPTYYSYMNPEVRIELDRAAYGDPTATQRVNSWLPSSSDSSTIFCFDEVSDESRMHVAAYQHTDSGFKDGAIKELAGSEATEKGVEKWNEYTGRIDNLRKEYGDILTRTGPKHHRKSSLLEENSQIFKEAFFLEGRVKKQDSQVGSVPPTPRASIARFVNWPTPTKDPFQPMPRSDNLQTPTRASGTNHSRRSSQPADGAAPCQPHPALQYSQPHLPEEDARSFPKETSSPDSKGANSNTTNDPSLHQPRRLRRKERIERYFMEQQERQIININKTKAMDETIEVELKQLVEAVQGLTAVHKNLCDDLGIKNISEIPDLIPKRKKAPRPFDPPTEESAGEESS